MTPRATAKKEKELNPKRYQRYFKTKYLKEDRGIVKIYVVNTLKDNEVLYGEGEGKATSITPHKDPFGYGPKGWIDVKRVPCTYKGFVMNEKTYEKLIKVENKFI